MYADGRGMRVAQFMVDPRTTVGDAMEAKERRKSLRARLMEMRLELGCDERHDASNAL